MAGRSSPPGLGGGGGGRRPLGGLLRRAARQQELHHVVERQGRRARRRPDEPGDAGGVAHRGPRVVRQVHAHQDVAGQHLAIDLLALAVLDLGDLFGGHLHLEDVVADVEVLHPRFEVGFDLVLVSRVGVDDVPVAGLAAQFRLEGDGRVDLFGRLVGRPGSVGGLVRGRLVRGRLGNLGGRRFVRNLGSFRGLFQVDRVTRGRVTVEASHGVSPLCHFSQRRRSLSRTPTAPAWSGRNPPGRPAPP